MKKIYAILLLTTILLFTNIGFATPFKGSKKTVNDTKTKHLSSHTSKNWFIYSYGGISWEKSGTTTSVNLGNLNTNLYEASEKTAKSPWFGLGFGYRWFPYSNLLTTLGLEISYTRMVSEPGVVRPLFFINPNFDTLNYTYTLSSIPLLLVSQLGWKFNPVTPYFLLGIGASWNRASQYNEKPSNPNNTATPMRAMFQNRTEGNFAYLLGLGLYYQINYLCSLGIEYRYINLGEAHFNPTSQQATNELLSLGTLHSNALLIRLEISV